MENNTNSSKKRLFILLGILVVVVIVAIVVASQGKKPANVTSNTTGTPAANTPATTAPTATTAGANSASATPAVNALPAGTRVEAPGAALITKDNKVVNAQGVELKNNVIPGAVDAPQETGPVQKDQVAASAIKIDASAAGWKPAEFTVKANQPITLSISGTDQWAHVFAFRDAALSSVAVGIGGIETRAITFKAPAKGTYEFYCNVPGHAARGEVCKMIVQ